MNVSCLVGSGIKFMDRREPDWVGPDATENQIESNESF